MNLDNIKRGQIYKSYKELCKALEIKYNGGKEKENTLEEFGRFINYKKEGNTYRITSIKKNPELLSNNARRTDYLKDYERLILDLLANGKHDGIINMARTKIFDMLRIVKRDYGYYRFKAPSLAEITDISEVTIEDWYDTTSNLLIRNLEAVLNSLKKQYLVDWYKQKTVCEVISKKEQIQIDKTIYSKDDMESVISYDIRGAKTRRRAATDDERQEILGIEKRVCNELGCRDKRDIIRKGMWSKFKSKADKRVFEEMDIVFYYDSYKVICNKDHILKHWKEMNKLILDEEEKELKQKKLSGSIKEKIIDNAKERQKVARHEYLYEDKFTDKIVRVDDDYIEEYYKLNDRLLGDSD